MPLIIRASHEEQVLRSVDDTPGIVGFGYDETADAHGFIITSTWHPDSDPGTPSDVDPSAYAIDPAKHQRTYIDAETFVAALGDKELVALVAGYVCRAMVSTSDHYAYQGAFESIADFAAFAARVRDLLNARDTELDG